MWIFCQDGFYSAVAHRERPRCVLVRTRARADADKLAAWVEAQGLRRPKVEDTPTADYAHRLTVSQAVWARYVASAAEAIDYGNFKNSVHGEPGRDRAYMGAWAAMREWQLSGAYHG